jgi:hypothetical protein
LTAGDLVMISRSSFMRRFWRTAADRWSTASDGNRQITQTHREREREKERERERDRESERERDTERGGETLAAGDLVMMSRSSFMSRFWRTTADRWSTASDGNRQITQTHRERERERER